MTVGAQGNKILGGIATPISKRNDVMNFKIGSAILIFERCLMPTKLAIAFRALHNVGS